MKCWKPTKKILNYIAQMGYRYAGGLFEIKWHMEKLAHMNPADYLTWQDIEKIHAAINDVEIGDTFNEKRYYTKVLKLLKEDENYKLKRTSI